MDSLIRKLAANWKLKLAAFALAIFLWIAVSADQVTSEWIPVPVRVQVTDPGYQVVDGPVPEQVRVRFSGRGRELWELALTDRPTLVLPVEEVNGGAEHFALIPEMVQVASGLTVAARDVEPSTVLVQFGEIGTREVPVAVRIGEGPGDGRAIAGTLEVDPAFVRISGPVSRTREVDTVYTRPLDLTREDSLFRRSVPLDTSRLSDIRLATSEVEVSGRLDGESTRTITDVPVVTPEGTEAAPNTVTMELRGAESVLRAFQASELQVIVPPTMVPEQIPFAGIVLPMQISGVPPNVQAEPNPETVRIFPASEVQRDEAPTAESGGEIPTAARPSAGQREGPSPTTEAGSRRDR